MSTNDATVVLAHDALVRWAELQSPVGHTPLVTAPDAASSWTQ